MMADRMRIAGSPMKGFIYRASQRLQDGQLLADRAGRDGSAVRAAPLADGGGARLRRPHRAPSGTAVRPPPRRARQSAGRPIRKRARTRSAPSRSTCGATWRASRPNTSFSSSCSTTTRADPNQGRIEARGIEIYERVAAEKKAHIIFTAHLGNFELIPIAGEAFGLHATAMFRPPNNPYIAEYILSTRRAADGKPAAVAAPAPRSRWPASSKRAAISAFWSTRSSSTA